MLLWVRVPLGVPAKGLSYSGNYIWLLTSMTWVRVPPTLPNIMKEDVLKEVRKLIQESSLVTSIYLGGDSEVTWCPKLKGWAADYALAVVIHHDSQHGCSVRGYVEREPLYTKEFDKPSMRLMTEVYKVAELYLALEDVIGDRHVEVHLDINPSKDFASNAVVQQAIGYIKGVCNIQPGIKPKAFAASYAADRLKFILAQR